MMQIGNMKEKKMNESNDEMESAIHEAGHALMYKVNDIKIKKVSIIPEKYPSGNKKNHGQLYPDEHLLEQKLKTEPILTKVKLIMCEFGGDAEFLYKGREIEKPPFEEYSGSWSLEYAREVTANEKEARSLCESLGMITIHILKRPENWKTIETFAEELCKRKEMDQKEIYQILKRTNERRGVIEKNEP